MSRLGRGKIRAFEEPTVNLTPLIDVVFVILIGFIIVAPLLELDQVELANAPSASNHPPVAIQEMSPISIHVRSDNSIWYKNEPILLPRLIEFLKKDKIHYPKAIPQLFHDKRGHFGTYQEVKNALEAAGFDQLDIILKP